MRNLGSLFLTFAKIGCLTFGGGYAILPVIERELIKKREWTTLEEVMRYYAVAQIAPGLIAVNLATFIGHKRAGLVGGIAATTGFVVPSATMTVIIASVLQNFAAIPIIQHCFNGIRLVVGALLLSTVIKLIQQLPRKPVFSPRNFITFVIFAISFVLLLIVKTNPVFIIMGAVVAGFFIIRNSPAEERSNHDKPHSVS